MGHAPSGVVARRTCPSSVASLRESDPRPRGLPSPCRTILRSTASLSRVAPGSPKVGSRMVRAGRRGGGWSPKSSLRTGSATFFGADHRARREGGGLQSLLSGHFGCFQQGTVRKVEPRYGRGSGGAVLRQDRPLRDCHGNLDIISMSPVLVITSHRGHASVYGCFWKNFVVFFLMKGGPGSLVRFTISERGGCGGFDSVSREFCSFFALLQVVWS